MSRRSQRSRAGTWLPGLVPTLHGEYSVDGTTVSFLLTKNLKLTKNEEEKERRRDANAGNWIAVKRPDDDAWREWKSVSLGLPSREERMSKRKRKRRRKKLPKSSLARAPRTWKPGHYFYCPGPCFVFLRSFSAQHLVRQWIHFMRQALWCSGSCRAHRRQRQWYGLLALLVLMYLALCSLR